MFTLMLDPWWGFAPRMLMCRRRPTTSATEDLPIPFRTTPRFEGAGERAFSALVLSFALILMFGSASTYSQVPIRSADDPLKSIRVLCAGRCAATILIGRQLDTAHGAVWGITKQFVPPWDYEFGNSYFVGGALSHTFLDFGRFAALEIEGGVGQRFGSLHETEVWSAIYLRWRYFPWNDFLVTTWAVSTGISYASAVTPYEISESPDGGGSRVMHYFSPEFTFALPKRPERELVFRFHHRSGGGEFFGNYFPVYGSLFRGTKGGTQYLTIGLRNHF